MWRRTNALIKFSSNVLNFSCAPCLHAWEGFIMPKITAKFIEGEVSFSEGSQHIIRDDELKGFGLRVSKGCVSFIVERKVGDRVRRVTLGKYGAMTPDQARKQA